MAGKVNNMIQDQYTIGVEEEYMICHPKTGELINLADSVIDEVLWLFFLSLVQEISDKKNIK